MRWTVKRSRGSNIRAGEDITLATSSFRRDESHAVQKWKLICILFFCCLAPLWTLRQYPAPQQALSRDLPLKAPKRVRILAPATQLSSHSVGCISLIQLLNVTVPQSTGTAGLVLTRRVSVAVSYVCSAIGTRCLGSFQLSDKVLFYHYQVKG